VGTSDVFVNVVGGVRIDEPGADLAVALAVTGAARGVTLAGESLACFGEIGLTGELRTVAHADRRAAEARKFGLQPVIGPTGSGATEAATLRHALRLALPRADRMPRSEAA
jgi:DNA repair protein RadA/Sms